MTWPRTLGFALTCLLFVAVGGFALLSTFDIWQAGEYLLTARRPVPRLITQAAAPAEFVLRCLFLATMGGAMFTAGLLGLAALAARWIALGRDFRDGAFDVGRWARLGWLPLALAAVFLGLLLVLAVFYD